MSSNLSRFGGLIIICSLFGLSACEIPIRIQSDQPIEINLNIKIDQEVRYKIDQDVEDLVTDNPGIF